MDILELIATILFMPFESKYDDAFVRIKKYKKGIRIVLGIFLIAIPIALIIGLYCLFNYFLRGNWI